MTYEEATKEIEDLGIDISIETNDETLDQHYLVLKYNNGEKFGWISNNQECRYRIDISPSMLSRITFSEREWLISLITALAMTPLEDREPKPKQYYVHVIPWSNGYLNFWRLNNGQREECQISNKIQVFDCQTKFTADEINKLADDNPDSLLIHFDPDNPVFEEVKDDD